MLQIILFSRNILSLAMKQLTNFFISLAYRVSQSQAEILHILYHTFWFVDHIVKMRNAKYEYVINNVSTQRWSLIDIDATKSYFER